MKKTIATLLCCCLLTGCTTLYTESPFAEPSTAEALPEVTVVTTTATISAEQAQPQEDAPTLYCDFTAEEVRNPRFSGYIRLIDGMLAQYDFQGAVLLAFGDEIILADGYGYADEQTDRMNTAMDTFEIGSVSKQMTAAAIMQLQEQGKLSVDDTLDKYFPEWEHGKNITVKHLLQMRSGLFDYVNSAHNVFPEEVADEYLLRADSDNEDTPDFERDFLLEYLFEAPLYSNPDHCYHYSNTNYYLLGLIIEQLSGMTYQQYLDEYIFAPCGMETANNGFRETTARGYYWDGTSKSMRTSTSLGCGSVNGSVYDLYQWLMHLFGGTVVSDSSLDEMTDAVDGYGYGVRCDDSYVYHVGNTDVFNAFASYRTADGFTVIVLANTPRDEMSAGFIATQLMEYFS